MADIEALTSRPVPADDVLVAVRWSPYPRPATTRATLRTAVLPDAAGAVDAPARRPRPRTPSCTACPARRTPTPRAARAHVRDVLRLLRTWQADERLAGTRLVVVTPPGSPRPRGRPRPGPLRPGGEPRPVRPRRARGAALRHRPAPPPRHRRTRTLPSRTAGSACPG
ncbi:hypothetical protein LT493_05095 [Streptomyces tricolor]|nr:hypothetical protein [Streptomyces tricolor]